MIYTIFADYIQINLPRSSTNNLHIVLLLVKQLENILWIFFSTVMGNYSTNINKTSNHLSYDLSSSVRKWQNTFQQGVDIFQKKMLKTLRNIGRY
jgi:hypothetical protein